MLASLRSVLRFRHPRFRSSDRRLARCASLGDLQLLARQKLPRGVFDYIDGGAEGERSLSRNQDGFDRILFRPRVLRSVGEVDTSTTLLGRPLALPLVLAPTGFTRIAHPLGELAVARAAERAEIPYTLSTLATRSIEEVALVSQGDKWFQAYVWRDRAVVREMLDRAAAAGYAALVITVDTPVLGRRERDVRRGFTLPPQVGVGTVLDGIVHPSWTYRFLTSDPIRFANVKQAGLDGESPVSLADYINTQFDPKLSWHDLEWFRGVWPGPIVLKGIQSVEDAVIAAETGIEAVALSNHGGRQLDSSPAPIDLVGPVAQALQGRSEIICDGGIRRGSDIVKAVALGATACMAGRASFMAWPQAVSEASTSSSSF